MRVQNVVVAVALLAFGANALPAGPSAQVARRSDEEWTKVLTEEKRSPTDEEWTKVLAEAKRSDEEWTKVLAEEKRSPSDEEWTKVLAEESVLLATKNGPRSWQKPSRSKLDSVRG
ncbi:uncharacterized protein BO80DRAFT_503826 [Aspergillus ibericus CBS 121593]|uniref:Secreted RxLR effector peptide protein n=1 Tax=Aspergillus ibericus CBS 121593 TaxID=1448316 RepID=A0A395GTG3_9EURO|nr:hypothetical protein BO80DRAFT_503826 [Aspergillus ibericus CBS 121593]RAK98815.1 hypothetical protein BO80DRAFT_503826 [Aspergillus ibericus CBS 121593]